MGFQPFLIAPNGLKALTGLLTENGPMLFTYDSMPACRSEDYHFSDQSEDQGLAWVPDRIKESGVYGSAWYSDAGLQNLLKEVGVQFRIIHDFSGSQSAVWVWRR